MTTGLSKRKMSFSKKHLSVRNMVDNPTGVGSAFFYSRAKIKKELNAEFIFLLQRYRKLFSATPILYPDGRIMFFMRIPSSGYQHNKIIYDILVEISAQKDRRLALRDARFFSNSPSFVFTYAYVFIQDDLMIERFSNLLPRKCLTDAPTIRNPIGSLGFEKTLFFACRYLLDGFCLSDKYIAKFGVQAKVGIDTRISNQITSVEKIVILYQHANDLKTKSHRKPIDQSRRSEREKIKQDYIERRKEDNRAKYIKTGHSKINARKARRIISSKKS